MERCDLHVQEEIVLQDFHRRLALNCNHDDCYHGYVYNHNRSKRNYHEKLGGGPNSWFWC